MNSKKEVIEILGLIPLEPEGGMFKKTYFSDITLEGGLLKGYPKERALSGAIYYLLTPDTYSCMHRLTADEIWYHHTGPAVRMLLIHPDGTSEIRLLGSDLSRGERPQILVPKGSWQGAMIDTESYEECLDARREGSEVYTLMSTQMAPEYIDDDFETATYDELKGYVTEDQLGLLRALTGEDLKKCK